MIGGMGSAVTPDLSKGGEIDGDITITGDLKVEGGGSSFAYDQIIEGNIHILNDDGLLIISPTTGNEDSYVRLTEVNGTSFAGGLLRYDGGTDVFTIGTHNTFNKTLSDDIAVINIPRDGSGVGIGTTSPATNLHITHPTANQYTNVRIDQGTSQYTAKLHFGGLLASNADYLIGEIAGIWDINDSVNPVSAIRFETGADTTNKDDGRLTFWTSSASRSLAERMRIEPDGSVGIGVTPTHTLHALSTENKAFLLDRNTANNPTSLNELSSYYSLSIKNRASGSYLNFAGDSTHTSLQATDGEGSATAKILNLNPYGGNVGIGTTSPSAKLEINGGAWNTSLIIKGSGSSEGIVFKDSDNNVDGYIYAYNTAIGFLDDDADWAIKHTTDTSTEFLISNSTRMMITSAGNVGIGTTSPSGDGLTGSASPALEISGTYPVLQLHDTDDDNYKAVIGTNGGKVYLGGTGSAITALQLYVQGGLKMKLDNNSRISLSNNDSGTENTVFGYTAGANIDAGSNYNVYIGHQTAASGTHDDAVMNTAVGYRAMYPLTSGDYNTALGSDSLRSITTGGSNVAVGSSAGYAITIGTDNVAIGRSAGTAITEGLYNVAIGSYALDAITTQSNMVAVGYQAGTALNDTGANGSVLIGLQAGKSQTTAVSTFIGCRAGAEADAATTNAVDNTYVGYESGRYLDDGTNNTALGHQAMRSADADGQNANNNSAVGYQALYSVTDGDNNVGIGSSSLREVTTVIHNVAIGSSALDAVTTTTRNVAVGSGAGGATTGTGNVFIGNFAGSSANVDNAVIIGRDAGENLTGSGTVAIGYQAGNLLTSGADNTIIGYDADVDANDRGGCIIIGKGLSLNTASDNVVEIGNNTNSMTYDLDGGDITVTSDVRTKKNIQDTKLGLEFINRLRPITYETKPSSEYPKEFGIKEPSNKSSNKTWDGLIAQEVKAVMDDMDVGFSGWEEGINTKQRLAYGKFVMPLIKSVQELSEQVKQLKKQLEEK